MRFPGIRDICMGGIIFLTVFVPVISKTLVFNKPTGYQFSEPLIETGYYWPWLTVIRRTPAPELMADQIAVSGAPWSLLIFFPSLYLLKTCYQIVRDKDRNPYIPLKMIGLVTLQMLLQITVFFSQEPDVSERRTIYLIPQLGSLLFILLYSISLKFDNNSKSIY